MPDIVVVVGNPRAGSRTRKIAEALAESLRQGPFQVLELAETIGVSFGPQPAYGAKDGVDPFTTVRGARLLVVATPAYKGSYTGLLKLFLDRFGHRELAGVKAIPVVVAASAAHASAAASALGDVLTELGAQAGPALAVTEAELAGIDAIAGRYEWKAVS